MKIDDEIMKALAFDPPEEASAAEFGVAEKACIAFPAKILERYRALRKLFEEKTQEAQRYWEEKEDLNRKMEGYLVRNLIPIMDQCKLVTEVAPAPASPPTPQIAPEEPADPMATMRAPEAADAGVQPLEFNVAASAEGDAAPAGESAVPPQPAENALDLVGLVGRIERQILSLLNGMGIQRVELMGKTYDNVEVDGEPIPEPFAIRYADTGNGVVVSKVIEDLWVRRRYGAIQVVRKGSVIC